MLTLARAAFGDAYSDEVLRKWLTVFYQRFFGNQWKRDCTADGPKVGTVALSPRGDWRMPSDAVVQAWIEDIAGRWNSRCSSPRMAWVGNCEHAMKSASH